MEALVWSGRMSVGVEAIDQQHQALFALYNRLLVVLSSGVANKVFGLSDDVMQGLADYVSLHFAFEEELMAKAAYPGLEAHKAEHRLYIGKIQDAQTRLDRHSPPEEWEDLCVFLAEWLKSHVLGADRDYIPYLTAAPA